MEVFPVAEKNDNWSKKRVNSSVNPQGLSEDVADQQPKSQLEQRSKKNNTKIQKVNKIDHTLEYLRESLSNYMDNEMCQKIVSKIESNNYTGEGKFVKDLNEEEIQYLNDVLEQELKYAKNVQHDIRVKELTEVYELLF